jgi:hypothetical protein
MTIPVFDNIRVVDENGIFTPEWRAILQNLFQTLQDRFSNEGLVMPSQSVTNINLLNNSDDGALVYDETTNLPKIRVNGVWEILNFSPSPLTLPVPIVDGGTGQTTQQNAINALTGTQVNKYYLRSDGTNATLSPLNVADFSGVLGISNGGTGQSTQQNAINALTGAVTNGYVLRGDGTNVSMSAIQTSDLPYTTPIQLTVNTTINGTGLTIGVPYTYQSTSVSIITLTLVGGITFRNPPALNGSTSTIGFNENDVFTLTRYSDSTILIT